MIPATTISRITKNPPAVPIPGSAEGGLTGAFTLYGTPLSLAVGGILLYRVFHAGVPFLLGALGLADMGRAHHDGTLGNRAEGIEQDLTESERTPGDDGRKALPTPNPMPDFVGDSAREREPVRRGGTGL